MGELVDLHGRRILYLRVSVTNNCNLKCAYCAGGTIAHTYGNRENHLSSNELIRVIKCAAKLGIKGVRITGGEPLMRDDIVDLVNGIAALSELNDISMTTNGMLLSHHADALCRAGLKRINISLDSLIERKLEALNGASSLRILEGIEAALNAGFECVKLNCVVMRGFNLDEVIKLASLSIDRPLHVRFIELQPVGCERNFFLQQFISAAQVLQIIKGEFELEPIERADEPPGLGPARYFRIKGALGTVGFIAPVSEPFCISCNRLRLTYDGILRACLAYNIGVDMKRALKGGDEMVEEAFRRAAMLKPLGHNYACIAEGTYECPFGNMTMKEIGG
ncbi:MAG: GTP 3',8-cyclase MoaA [Armatimonadota bacterium]|nr:GTP 3',8-cyclase MoaA [Armatimonadota bacterium]MCX7776899.1 GTP 3',8-cyclase MoaA [Armatimonadota bacterium]MDW8024415.1 GTP 3',8-cyclase MoaA [Armatimonadota bacterium]